MTHETKDKARQELLARFGYVCAICGRAIDRALPYRHPEGLTLDHIRPRSIGGTNDLSNLQLAHGRCNLERDRIRLGRVARRVGVL